MSNPVKGKSVCREYRVVALADLPQVHDDADNLVDATDDDLAQLGIHVFYRGSRNACCIFNGFEGEDRPGELITGRVGMKRDVRCAAIDTAMRAYRGGDNGGKRALMDTALPEETTRVVDGVTVPGRILSPAQRLARRLPRIMGD